jgi:dipeptidyl aminopeptidase/acylaminoacyl peptidase
MTLSETVTADATSERIRVIHGEADRDTPPDHSRRVFAALGGPKRLIIVPGAQHNGSLRPEVWSEIERWIDTVLETKSSTM